MSGSATMESEKVGARDWAVVAGEIGRPPHDLTGIAARCPFGYPAVTETAPVLTEGAPNPTLLYLTCPALATAVSRAEAAGAVRKLKSSCRDDEDLRDLLQEITRLYRERRATLVGERIGPLGPDPRLGAGIGGPEGPELAACLHAYAAALLAVTTGWLASEDATIAERARRAWMRFLPPVEESWCRDNRCARWDTARRRAAIDVGTISVRLLVADLTEGRPYSLAREAEVTRLGEGLQPGGVLNKVARLRTAAVVARYAQEARTHGVDSIILAGTSAAREAADGAEFIRALGSDNDLRAMVLSGEREAEFAYAGASLDIAGDAVVLDVGGGSTEVIRRLKGGAVRAVSLEIGASRATEQWIRSDPPTSRELANVFQEAEWAFSRVGFRFSADGADVDAAAEDGAREASDAVPAPRRLVGVAGTVTTLACLDAGLAKYDGDLLHLRTLSLESVRGLVERLGALTTEERAALPCVQPGRAPVIVAGAVIVLAAMQTLGYSELTVSERDLLDGLVLRAAW